MLDEKNKHKKNKRKKHKKIILGIIVIAIFISVIGWYYVKKDISNIEVNKSKGPIVLAMIDNEPITDADVQKEMKIFFFVTGYPEESQSLITAEMFLNQTISQRLLLKEAIKQGIDVEEDTIISEFELLFSKGMISKEEFIKILEGKGLNFEEIISYSRDQAIILKLINETVMHFISASDKEAEEYYNNNKNLFDMPEQVKASHILLATKEEAEKILKELNNNKDFNQIAKEKSIDPSARFNGGDLGYFSKGQMVKEFENAAFSLKIGEISKIVQTQFGFHIIKVEDKKKEGLKQFTEIKEEIKSALIQHKQNELIQQVLEMLWEDTDVKFRSKIVN